MQRNVMIVDDDFDMALALADALTDEGYAVTTASDGLEALERLRTDAPKPCVILLDWMMPRCDAPTFRKIQREEPAIASIPVVLLTADGKIREKSAAIDATAALPKPVKLESLLSIVGSHCS